MSSNKNTVRNIGIGIAGIAFGFLAGLLFKEEKKEEVQSYQIQPHSQQNEQAKLQEIDSEFIICPISNQIMTDPQVLNCGHSFEKQSILDWQKKKNMCPICQREILKITPNFQLKDLINNIKGK